MGHYVVGVDLGQSQDHTALTVVERIPQFAMKPRRQAVGSVTILVEERIEQPPLLHCRQLGRADLGTKYPEIVRKVKAMLGTPQLKDATLVVDGTGVGRAVIDMFREAGLRPLAVHITSGATAHFEDGYWYTPKRDLVAAAQVPLQDKRLVFTQASELNEVLVKEMMDFKIKITAAANDTYGSWREGQHDDLIFSVMLACWAAQRFKPRQKTRSHEY
jgi:hypothetical protein